jgi:hypothetical protein
MNRNVGDSRSPMTVLLTVAIGMVALTAEDGGGVLLFMLSAVLSRGVAAVRADMDHSAGAPLIGGHGYCMQVGSPRRPRRPAAPPPRRPAPAPPRATPAAPPLSAPPPLPLRPAPPLRRPPPGPPLRHRRRPLCAGARESADDRARHEQRVRRGGGASGPAQPALTGAPCSASLSACLPAAGARRRRRLNRRRSVPGARTWGRAAPCCGAWWSRSRRCRWASSRCWRRSTQVCLRVRLEKLGSQTCGIVGKSQSVLIMSNPMILTRTRTWLDAHGIYH